MKQAVHVRAYPVPAEDPAGADKLIVAAAHGITRWAEQFVASRFGVAVNWWDGPEGLGKVVEGAVQANGVPNKRFAEIVTPRRVAQAVANEVGLRLVPDRKKRLRKK